VLLPVGITIELLPGKVLVVTTGGSVKPDVKPEVVLLPGPGVVAELMGVSGVIVLSVGGTVEFVIGGRTGSLMVAVSVSDTGGSVTVAGAVVETPVPGPVIPSVGPRTELEVEVAFGDGSKTLEMAEPISPRRELSGLPGSELLELIVTIPVGAIRIPDVLVVVSSGSALLLDEVGSSSTVLLVLLPGRGGSTVDDGSSGSLDEVGSSSTVLLELLPGRGGSSDGSSGGRDGSSGGRSVDEGRSGSLVEVSLDELSAGELVLPDVVSVAEAVSDGLSVEEVSSDELPLDEETLDELSLAELLSDGSLELLSDVLSLEDTLLDALSVVEDELEVGVGRKGGETITVTGTTMVVTLESLDESDSELDCLLVVSNEVDGGKLSCDVVVALVTCRLTWRGK
jgi:hypothetical protein